VAGEGGQGGGVVIAAPRGEFAQPAGEASSGAAAAEQGQGLLGAVQVVLEGVDPLLGQQDRDPPVSEGDLTLPAGGGFGLSPRPRTAGAVRPDRRAGVARQAAQARRAYAVTVLRGLARTQHGRPVAQVRRLVKDALTLSGCGSPPTRGSSSPATSPPAGPSPCPDLCTVAWSELEPPAGSW